MKSIRAPSIMAASLSAFSGSQGIRVFSSERQSYKARPINSRQNSRVEASNENLRMDGTSGEKAFPLAGRNLLTA